jgi:DNA invertase Pin-like site-specific DNA recombinase
LAQALALCRVHRAKLIVAKLDRLARNVGFLTTLMNDGVEFTCCDMPQANKLTIHILAAVAEAEAEAISQRTKAALEAAKARGVALGGHREGSFPGNSAVEGRKRGTAVLQRKAAKRRQDLMPIIEAIKAAGITSLRGIADELNARGIPAPRGGQWSITQVFRLLR